MQKKYALTLVVLLFTLLLAAGCQKKQEQQQPAQKQADTTAVKDTAKKADTTAKNATQQAQAADLKGTWRGTFEKRPATLKITEQNGNNFKGSISINFRQAVNQQVSGSFDPATKRFTMKDLLHSRFQGNYAGKVSDDMQKLSGTFTMTLDGSKFNFNLAKK